MGVARTRLIRGPSCTIHISHLPSLVEDWYRADYSRPGDVSRGCSHCRNTILIRSPRNATIYAWLLLFSFDGHKIAIFKAEKTVVALQTNFWTDFVRSFPRLSTVTVTVEGRINSGSICHNLLLLYKPIFGQIL